MKLDKQQIVATIGPDSGKKQNLQELQEAGATVFRLNMSHGTHAEHKGYIENIKSIGDTPIIMDLSGPRVDTSKGEHGYDPTQPSLTAKDIHDLSFGINNKVDWFALSFPSDAEDILRLKKEMKKIGTTLPIMAKIEHGTAVKNIEEIITAADAVMVGRGDLGKMIGLENTPATTLAIIRSCRQRKTPVIIATEILESMHEKEAPTRAEATDAWLHGYSGATGILLSGETAIGKHPAKAVQWASKLFAQGKKDREDKPYLASSEL